MKNGVLRVGWLTDIHLDFVEPQAVEQFLKHVGALALDAVVLSGDIGDARSVIGHLEHIDDVLRIPLYFVLGNHDYYFGSIAEVRQAVGELTLRRPRLHYLTASETFSLGPRWGLVGHDGWADGREGDYAGSYVMMNDYKLIRELAPYPKFERLAQLQKLADEAADHVRRVLPRALRDHEQVLFVTHVPPTRSACWYDGRISDDEWSPHFTCRAVGDALLEVMQRHPDRRLTVLCGHTHGEGQCQPLENVTIYTGGATYGAPEIKRVFELG